MSETRRTFIGIQPPPSVAESLARAVRATLTGPGLRIYPAGDLHGTLAFLGEVPLDQLPRLAAALDTIVHGLPSISLSVAQTGAFPGRGRERVLWAGVEPSAALDAIFVAAETAARDSGLAPIQHARGARVPHVTLARVTNSAAPIPDAFYALRFALKWTVGEVVVCESDRRPGASPRYPIVHRSLLAGAAGS